MNSKTTSLFSFCTFLFFLMLLAFPSTGVLFAQKISPKILPFEKICAGGPYPNDPSKIFNEFQAQFKISGFDPSETFVVELSDPSGNFTTPIATIPLPPLNNTPPDTATDKTLTFAIPTDIVGSDNYELRIKSSPSGVVSPSFTIFGTISNKSLPVYFKSYSGSFFINDKKDVISFCSGSSLTLTVYNPTPTIPDSSPANYPQLKYHWYKDDVLIAGQSSSSLVVNTVGVYYAELNYGPCSDFNNSSQSVTVTSGAGPGGPTIVSSLGNPFCSSDQTTLTATAGNSYIWKKDGSVIAEATGQTYQTNVSGVYTCDIDFGGCTATGSIDLKSTGTITANYKNIYIDKVVTEGETLTIAKGDTLNVAASTIDSNPTYQWYFNNGAIAGANQSALVINAAGSYKAIISGCAISFRVSDGTVYKTSEPTNIVSVNSDGINDTWIVPDVYSNSNTHVVIFNSFGENVFETNDYDNYNGWPQSSIEVKSFNPIYYYIITPNGESAKKGSITLLK
ncbi:gliding motility-associated C-terminal domain-containing protein [Flavobacterium sp. 5]|uniref:T9SS type B sorting domain-containing protein n=1 Tax=Flavobacterium sp. 5 TaxID=2035199 RepID=UPI000C2BB403|nr:gliding motility-associated C-terminal domain-containing protein [Flavobacterium sp. 5]PKB16684.1 protein involved in gliding motility SprC [Flavobacterium sp. 5]